MLEERLAQALGTPVTVRNAAVGGWAPDQYLLQARRAFTEEGGYAVVLVSLFLDNDVLATRREQVPPLEPRLVHPFRLPHALRWGELIDAVLYPINDRLETRSQLFVLIKKRAQTLLMHLGLSPAWFETIYYRSELASPRWTVTSGICSDIARLGTSHGASTLFVLIPASYQVDATIFRQYVHGLGVDTSLVDMDQPGRVLGDSLRARGLAVIDATPALRDAYRRGRQVFGRVDTHLSPQGHEVVAQLVEAPLAALLEARRRRPS
jgi:hypothetical protein